jgi:hypothetical protein
MNSRPASSHVYGAELYAADAQSNARPARALSAYRRRSPVTARHPRRKPRPSYPLVLQRSGESRAPQWVSEPRKGSRSWPGAGAHSQRPGQAPVFLSSRRLAGLRADLPAHRPASLNRRRRPTQLSGIGLTLSSAPPHRRVHPSGAVGLGLPVWRPPLHRSPRRSSPPGLLVHTPGAYGCRLAAGRTPLRWSIRCPHGARRRDSTRGRRSKCNQGCTGNLRHKKAGPRTPFAALPHLVFNRPIRAPAGSNRWAPLARDAHRSASYYFNVLGPALPT